MRGLTVLMFVVACGDGKDAMRQRAAEFMQDHLRQAAPSARTWVDGKTLVIDGPGCTSKMLEEVVALDRASGNIKSAGFEAMRCDGGSTVRVP